jgi:hypothetical protein
MAAYVQSGSQSHAEELAARIEAGMDGRERGEIAFGEFLETKAVIRAA